MKKWTEVNIHVNDPNQLRRVILSFVKPYVKVCKTSHQIDSWHFFFEICPLIGHRNGEPEIRLRFYAESTEISQIENELKTKLDRCARSTRNPIIYYHFGKHGHQGKYRGERGEWGNDWPMVMKQYNNGSEHALEFLSKRNLHAVLSHYGERYVHLLLNQLIISHKQVRIVDPNGNLIYIIMPE